MFCLVTLILRYLKRFLNCIVVTLGFVSSVSVIRMHITFFQCDTFQNTAFVGFCWSPLTVYGLFNLHCLRCETAWISVYYTGDDHKLQERVLCCVLKCREKQLILWTLFSCCCYYCCDGARLSPFKWPERTLRPTGGDVWSVAGGAIDGWHRLTQRKTCPSVALWADLGANWGFRGEKPVTAPELRHIALKRIILMMAALWVVAPCSLVRPVNSNQSNCATTHKTAIITVTAVRTSSRTKNQAVQIQFDAVLSSRERCKLRSTCCAVLIADKRYQSKLEKMIVPQLAKKYAAFYVT
jgi:hypothetical protein